MKHHLTESDTVAFSRSGDREPITWPSAHLDSRAELLLDQITSAPDREKALAILTDALFDANQDGAIEGGARYLCEAIHKLGDTAAGLALRRVVMNDETPLREVSKVAGVSHVAIFKTEHKIQQKWGLTKST